MSTKPLSPSKRDNPFVGLIFSMAIPYFILNKMSGEDKLGSVNALIVALAFPLVYAAYDFWKRKKVGFIPALGFISILLTGLFALFQLPVQWIAVKEASIPAVIGLMILISLRTKSPLVQELLYNENVIAVDKVEARLETTHHKDEFQKLMRNSSLLLALSFLISAILNYVLAVAVLKSQPGTPEFNSELANMQLLSWPVIVIPSTLILFFALWRLLKGLKKLTGMETEEILNTQSKS